MCCRLADGRRTTKYHVSWKKKNCFFLSKDSLKTIPFCHVAIGKRRLDMATGCHLKSSTRMETDREEMRNGRKLSYYKKSCFVDLTRHGVSLYMICSIIVCFHPSGTIICKQINDLVSRFQFLEYISPKHFSWLLGNRDICFILIAFITYRLEVRIGKTNYISEL